MLNLAIAAIALLIVFGTRVWLRSRLPTDTGSTDAYTRVKLQRLRAARSADQHVETAPQHEAPAEP